MMKKPQIYWTEYMRYRVSLRHFDLAHIEHIVRYSDERYMDMVTGSYVVIGCYEGILILVPYEIEGNVITPITVHATTRAQITARLRSGRFTNE